jgi:hypothetical protein
MRQEDIECALAMLGLALFNTLGMFGLVALVQWAGEWQTAGNLLAWGTVMSIPGIAVIGVLYRRGCNRPPL